MTHDEFSTVISGIGLANAYDHFTDDTEREPPFICYIYPNRTDFVADNTNYQPIEYVRVEFYSTFRDFDTEKTIGTALNEAGLVYSLASEYLNGEEMWMTVFYTSFVLTESEEIEDADE